MRILYINKIVTNAGWGFETLLNTELQRLGIETICLDYHQHRYRITRALLDLQEDFDALLLERGTGYLIPAAALRAIQRPRIFLFTELVARNPAQHYLLRDRLFDHVFLRSHACIEQVIAQGWLQPSQVELFLSAIEPSLHRVLPNQPRDIDVLFIGTITPRRQAILAQLQDALPLTVAGAYGQDMVTLMNRAKVILNIHGEEHLDTETRIYEALACGGFVITERLSIESPFTSGQHLIEVNSLEEMVGQTRHYLHDLEARTAIAQAGRTLVCADHTVAARARQLEAILRRFAPQRRPTITTMNRPLLSRAQWNEQRRQLWEQQTRPWLGRIKRALKSRLSKDHNT
jgi:hypothetical protein